MWRRLRGLIYNDPRTRTEETKAVLVRVYLSVGSSGAFRDGMATGYGLISQRIYKIHQPKGRA